MYIHIKFQLVTELKNVYIVNEYMYENFLFADKDLYYSGADHYKPTTINGVKHCHKTKLRSTKGDLWLQLTYPTQQD